ncbi:MAG: hypothetical protein GY720_05865 [bacterium]|nr:hypothetical protein [bacterium]
MSKSPDRLPAGRQPYDGFNGLRIGALTGGILGIVATSLLSFSSIWLTVVGAVVGALAGYRWEKKSWT